MQRCGTHGPALERKSRHRKHIASAVARAQVPREFASQQIICTASGVAEAVCEALLNERATTTYPVAMAGDHDRPVLLLVHRKQSATVLASTARSLQGFDVRDYIDREVRFSLSERSLDLVLRLDHWVLPTFEETPLSQDRDIVETGENGFLLGTTVYDRMTLRGFLLGFGAALEVFEPTSLRDEMRNGENAMAGAYQREIRS